MLGIFLVLLNFSPLQLTEVGQAKLQRMVEERDVLTQEWKESESKKSGIFGNRTKKDMIETNNWFERILKKDNLIMDELRMINSIGSTAAVQTGDSYKAIALKQEQDIQKLQRKIDNMESAGAKNVSENRTFQWISFLLSICLVTIGYYYYKLRFKS
jgi:tRNA U34 5-carboxymethylaminomethyl modifying enzyme MnmG/GidA